MSSFKSCDHKSNGNTVRFYMSSDISTIGSQITYGAISKCEAKATLAMTEHCCVNNGLTQSVIDGNTSIL